MRYEEKTHKWRKRSLRGRKQKQVINYPIYIHRPALSYIKALKGLLWGFSRPLGDILETFCTIWGTVLALLGGLWGPFWHFWEVRGAFWSRYLQKGGRGFRCRRFWARKVTPRPPQEVWKGTKIEAKMLPRSNEEGIRTQNLENLKNDVGILRRGCPPSFIEERSTKNEVRRTKW